MITLEKRGIRRPGSRAYDASGTGSLDLLRRVHGGLPVVTKTGVRATGSMGGAVMDWVQYHNPERWGTSVAFVAEHEPFGVGTNKRPGDLFGARVWLIGGEGRPRRYFLCHTFVVDRIVEDLDDDFRWTLSGTQGQRFVPARDLTDAPWFEAFLRYNANFRFGLRRIPPAFTQPLYALLAHPSPTRH